jgi:starch-binding outer membrane protein, SusD/RagB family
MKKIYKIAFTVSFIALSAISCQKDVSVAQVYPDTSQTSSGILAAQLAGVYNRLATDQMYAQGFFGYINGGADEGFRSGATATNIFTELYNISSTETNIATLWRSLYQGIERANIVLDVVDKPEDLDEATKKDIRGQAQFLRAYYFYLLVNLFGDVPLKTSLSTDMGTNFNLPRESSKKVYDFIIAEMIAAEGLLKPMSAVNSTLQVTQSAAQGMLARVCLSAAGEPVKDAARYKDALTWAKKLIDSGNHGLYTQPLSQYSTTTPSYSRVFINNMQNNFFDKNTLEGIWDISFLSKSNATGTYANTGFPVTQTLGAIMGVYNPIATAGAVVGFSPGTYRAFPKLYNLYGAGDLRRDWAIAPYSYKDATTTRYDYLRVVLTGGGGTGATATAITNNLGGITSVRIDNGGTGYTTAPSVTFTSYANSGSTSTVGTGAVATANVANGKVTDITLTAAGASYATVYDRCVGKWRREYEVNLPPVRLQNNTSSNFPALRYADVLLMAAEADFKLNGSTAQGLEWLNQVRRRGYGLSAGAPSVVADLTALTMQDIMDERSRELCFEGLRRSDLIRWGVMPATMQSLLTDNQAKAPTAYQVAATLAATNFLSNPSKFMLLPIPNAELSIQPALTQNAGW